MARTRRPNGTPENPVRSVRVDDATWEKALRRSSYEGVTISSVLLAFVEGYANGMISPPRVQVVYDTSPKFPVIQASGSAVAGENR